MFIIFWRTYTYRIPVRADKIVACEQCGERYVYTVERMVGSQADSVYCLDDEGAKRRAKSKARSRIDAVLERACDPVPCPRCGWYQRPMVALHRRGAHQWMNKAGLWCVILALLVFIAYALVGLANKDKDSRASETAAQVLIGLVIGLMALSPVFTLLRLVTVRMVNPNHRPLEDRIALGRQRAITAREYAELQASQIELES